MTTPIYLHPEITIDEMRRLAQRCGLCLCEEGGRYVLQPAPALLLANGAPYRNSARTDIRFTIARAKAAQADPGEGRH
jgi:hypothetical protein